MMTPERIKPERITSPIQLAATWVTALAGVLAAFLTSAIYLDEPSWGPGLLIIAAVVYVPCFMIAVFLLQTKFRPELMGDTEYSKHQRFKYLDRSHQSVIFTAAKPRETAERIQAELSDDPSGLQVDAIEEVIRKAKTEELTSQFGPSRTLSELYLRPDHWPVISRKYVSDLFFQSDVIGLIPPGLGIQILPERANHRPEEMYDVHLTELGIEVARAAEAEGILFAQTNLGAWNSDRPGG